MVTGVILSLDKLIIAPGEDATLTVTVLPADAPDKGVNWESNNPGAAAVDQNGKVSGIAAGNATITVRTADGGRTAKCEVTVETGFVKVESVSLSPPALTILKNDTGDLTATVSPDNAQYKAVKWMSSNPGIADVDQNGTVTGIAGGSAVITVSTENGGFQDTCELTVNVPVESVSLDSTEITVKSNSTAQLSATVLPDDATNKNVTWTSSNTNVATVDQNGTVTGKAAGNAAITVTTEDGGKTASCAVTVHGYFDVANPQAWISALSSISGTDGGSAGNPTVFIINITGNVSVAGTSYASITGDNKEVRLTGGSGTLSLESDSNGSLIRTAANQTFIINGPTLQGRDGNNDSLVTILGGAVELLNGYIKGNKISYSGGGVCVDNNGTFKMTGGEISGNAAGGNYHVGGGVYVSDGTFKMTGGKISGNTASSSGGGVYVYGNFEMTGGKISGNTGSGGGGVVTGYGGNFTMTGGEISSNDAANSYGGGVYVTGGSFTMTGDVIYGNDAIPASLRNKANSGYGAAVYKSGSGAIDTTITQYPPNP